MVHPDYREAFRSGRKITIKRIAFLGPETNDGSVQAVAVEFVLLIQGVLESTLVVRRSCEIAAESIADIVQAAYKHLCNDLPEYLRTDIATRGLFPK